MSDRHGALPLPHLGLLPSFLHLLPVLLHLLQLPLFDQQSFLLLLQASCLKEKQSLKNISVINNTSSKSLIPLLPSASAPPSVREVPPSSSAPLGSFSPQLASTSPAPPSGSSRTHFQSVWSGPARPLPATCWRDGMLSRLTRVHFRLDTVLKDDMGTVS